METATFQAYYDDQREKTLAHFQRNPDCLYVIKDVLEDGTVIRDYTRMILVAPRLKPNWFTNTATWATLDMPQRGRGTERKVEIRLNKHLQRRAA